MAELSEKYDPIVLTASTEIRGCLHEYVLSVFLPESTDDMFRAQVIEHSIDGNICSAGAQHSPVAFAIEQRNVLNSAILQHSEICPETTRQFYTMH